MNVSEAKMILEINQLTIDLLELKKIFKKQMLKWHPDISVNHGVSYGEATIRSQKILLAYEILPVVRFKFLIKSN